MNRFSYLSDGQAFFGFEYPMNGKLVKIDPQISRKFKRKTIDDPVQQGKYKWYMTNEKSPLISQKNILVDEIKEGALGVCFCL